MLGAWKREGGGGMGQIKVGLCRCLGGEDVSWADGADVILFAPPPREKVDLMDSSCGYGGRVVAVEG